MVRWTDESFPPPPLSPPGVSFSRSLPPRTSVSLPFVILFYWLFNVPSTCAFPWLFRHPALIICMIFLWEIPYYRRTRPRCVLRPRILYPCFFSSFSQLRLDLNARILFWFCWKGCSRRSKSPRSREPTGPRWDGDDPSNFCFNKRFGSRDCRRCESVSRMPVMSHTAKKNTAKNLHLFSVSSSAYASTEAPMESSMSAVSPIVIFSVPASFDAFFTLSVLTFFLRVLATRSIIEEKERKHAAEKEKG